MFEWLFPSTCPCNPPAKEWIEYRLAWLCDEFDDHAFNGRRIVLPTAEFFPARYDQSYDSVRDLLDQVCDYMDVDSQSVRLQIFDDLQRVAHLVNEHGQSLSEAGTYEEGRRKTIIRIAKSGLHDPMKLVGTMAHELAHKRLLGESRIMSEEFDNELLTDLTTVVFGLGIFQANSDRPLIRSQETWEGTDYTRPEYMTPPMYGYALAHLAWFRGEEKPSWAKHLHVNARPDFNQALRFLFKTGDSTFRPAKSRK